MQKNPASKLWQIGSLDKVDGKLAFDFYDTDADARAVVDNYIEKLATGIVDFANIFRPEAIIIGGGICAQGENLRAPLEKILKKELYAGEVGPKVDLLIAELQNDAGSLGAAALVF
jgi:glucokinase